MNHRAKQRTVVDVLRDLRNHYPADAKLMEEHIDSAVKAVTTLQAQVEALEAEVARLKVALAGGRISGEALADTSAKLEQANACNVRAICLLVELLRTAPRTYRTIDEPDPSL